MKKVALLAFSLSVLLACEKDDICFGDEYETPNLVINLYDRLEPENLKAATKVAAFANGYTDTLFFTNKSKIELPLKINDKETSWKLRLYELTPTNDTIFKIDELKFTYSPEALYVSKACGYKTIFHDFNAIKLENSNSDRWIQSIYKTTNEITNTINAHIQLYY